MRTILRKRASRTIDRVSPWPNRVRATTGMSSVPAPWREVSAEVLTPSSAAPPSFTPALPGSGPLDPVDVLLEHGLRDAELALAAGPFASAVLEAYVAAFGTPPRDEVEVVIQGRSMRTRYVRQYRDGDRTLLDRVFHELHGGVLCYAPPPRPTPASVSASLPWR